MRGISVWRKGIHRRGGQFRLKAFRTARAARLVTWPCRKLVPFSFASPPFTNLAIIFRSDGHCVLLDSWRVLVFSNRFFFKSRRWLTACTIDSLRVTGLNFCSLGNVMHTKTVYISVWPRHPVLNCLFGRERIDYGAVSD